ncbi:RNA recognition motif, partial [Trifolium pratense]
MRERGRERERHAATRAHLGQPSRSPPPPEVRQKRGGVSVDNGGWTEVRRRRRNGSRKDEGRIDSFRQNRQYQGTRSSSTPGHYICYDRHNIPDSRVRDRGRSGRSQSRCSREHHTSSRDQYQEHGHQVLLPSGFSRHRSESGRRQQVHRDDNWNPAFLEEGRRDNHDHYREASRNCSMGKKLGGDGGKNGDHDKDDVSKHDVLLVGDVSKRGDDGVLGTDLKRYVSFYFTNFPAQMSNFYLRKGFEVCGILEDVYVAKKRNKYGQPYGFVKFSNVKDVSKMIKALNNVWFGYFRIRASVAMFERNDSGAGRRMEKKKVDPEKAKLPRPKEGKQHSNKFLESKGGEENIILPGQQSQHVGIIASRAEKDGSDPADGMRVGDVVIKLGARNA